jgi:hypothetical protein
MLRQHALERHARVEREQRFDVLMITMARACGEVALVRQMLEVGPEQLAAGSESVAFA